MNQQKGFSAVEVLLAIVVVIILVGGTWVWREQKTPTDQLPSLTPHITSTEAPTPQSTIDQNPNTGDQDIGEGNWVDSLIAEYQGDAAQIASDYTNYIYFKVCQQEISVCEYYLLPKNKISGFPALQNITGGDPVKISAEFKTVGIATGNWYFELVSNIKIETVTPTPTSLLDEEKIKDWKTYTNTQYSYFLKYPPGYKPGMCNSCDDPLTTPLWILDPPQTEGYGRIMLTNLRDKNPDETTQDYLQQMIKTVDVNPVVVGSRENLQIDGRDALTVTTSNYSYESKNIVVLNGSTGLQISFAGDALPDNKGVSVKDFKNYATFELILSTFKFLD